MHTLKNSSGSGEAAVEAGASAFSSAAGGVEARRAFSWARVRLAIETYWVFDATRSWVPLRVPLVAGNSSSGGGLGLQRISDEVKRIGGPGLDGLIHRCR